MMLACESEIDVSSYLQLDGLQECGVNMEWHGELELSDCEERLEDAILGHVIRTPENRRLEGSSEYYHGRQGQVAAGHRHSYSSSSSIDSFSSRGSNTEFSWYNDQHQRHFTGDTGTGTGTGNSSASMSFNTSSGNVAVAGDKKGLDLGLGLGLGLGPGQGSRSLPAQMTSMVHTQPVHLIHVHNLKALQTSFEDEEAAASVAALEAAAAEAAEAAAAAAAAAVPSSSTPPSLADTRNNSVFSSTRSINNLLQDQQDIENDIKLMPATKKRSLVAPIMFPAGKSQVIANTNNIVQTKIKHRHESQKPKPNHQKPTKPVSEKDQFVYTLTNKLLPYFGYFLADSNDLEYFDKVRFQEIDYKFSKTYF